MSLSEAQAGDKKGVQRLEKELLNCSQEIGSFFFFKFFLFPWHTFELPWVNITGNKHTSYQKSSPSFHLSYMSLLPQNYFVIVVYFLWNALLNAAVKFLRILVLFHQPNLFVVYTDYLQDLLSARNAEVNYLEERVHSLELKLEGMEVLQEEVFSLREELKRLSSKHFSLIQELDHKEIELEKSALSMEKLEDSFSSIALESQFEVESMKLDMMALEQSLFEAKKIQEETLDENNKMIRSIKELQVALQDSQKTILSLNEENRELTEKLDTANETSKIYSQKDEYWLENKDRPILDTQSSLSEQGNNSTIEENTRYIFRSYI